MHWVVISIACSTRLEVFHCPEIKNIKKIEEKNGRRKPVNLDRPTAPPQTPQMNLAPC